MSDLKDEWDSFPDDVANDKAKARSLKDKYSRQNDRDEECVQLDEFLGRDLHYYSKQAKVLLSRVDDAKTEQEIERLEKKFNDLLDDYLSVRPNDLLGKFM